MATLGRLDHGVRICMYAGDRNPPHFHVLTGDGMAFTVRLDDLSVLAGRGSARVYALATAWARDNREFLVRRWEDLNERG